MADCELCGREADELFLIGLEGASLRVCRKCTSHGKIIPEPKVPGRISWEKQEAEAEDEKELVGNYGEIIRKKREQMGLSQEDFARKLNETVSVMRKIEVGKAAPSEGLARRIEKFCGIKLFAKAEKEV